MKRGLVLEGGAMRGLWTAGIIDVMMEHDVWPDGLIGVSAGAAFGCNYKSRQIGRAIRYNMRFARDGRYSGIRSLLTTGNYFNAEFGYRIIPKQYEIFDDDAFNRNPMAFIVVCTDVETGKAVYQQLDEANYDTYDWIRASASMPLVSRVVLVILTQPQGYQKSHNSLMPLMRIALRRYPEMIKAMDRRHLMYNEELEYVAQAEREGRCLVIRPDDRIPIGHISHDPAEMHHVYLLGRNIGERYIERIKEFWEISHFDSVNRPFSTQK